MVEGVKEVGTCELESGVEKRELADGTTTDHYCNRLIFTITAHSGQTLDKAAFEKAFDGMGYEVVSLEEAK